MCTHCLWRFRVSFGDVLDKKLEAEEYIKQCGISERPPEDLTTSVQVRLRMELVNGGQSLRNPGIRDFSHF